MAWALWAAGCAPPQAIRPPAITEDMDEAARKDLYEKYRLTCEIKDRKFVAPLLTISPRIRFSRSDGSYLPSQIADLVETYPEARSLMTFRRDKLSIAFGVDVAAMAGTYLLVEPLVAVFPLLAIHDAVGSLMVLPIDRAGPLRLANAYNRGLATELGLAPPPELVLTLPLPAGRGWLGGSVCFEGFLGMSVQSRSELDHFYGAQLWDPSRPWAPVLFGGAVDYALTDRWQVGVEWDPLLLKRARFKYPSGNVDAWTLDATGLLGRVRFFTPLNSSLGLVFTAAAGHYALSGAKLWTTYWYGSRNFTGSALGGYGTVGLERVVTLSSGVHVGLGYRAATIATNDPGKVWAQASRNGAMQVNHSGPFFTTAYRYYWGVARGPMPAPARAEPLGPEEGEPAHP